MQTSGSPEAHCGLHTGGGFAQKKKPPPSSVHTSGALQCSRSSTAQPLLSCLQPTTLVSLPMHLLLQSPGAGGQGGGMQAFWRQVFGARQVSGDCLKPSVHRTSLPLTQASAVQSWHRLPAHPRLLQDVEVRIPSAEQPPRSPLF